LDTLILVFAEVISNQLVSNQLRPVRSDYWPTDYWLLCRNRPGFRSQTL